MAPRKRPAARRSEKPVAEPTGRNPPEPAEVGCIPDESQDLQPTEEPEHATPTAKRPRSKAGAKKKPATDHGGESAAKNSKAVANAKAARTPRAKKTKKPSGKDAEPNPFESTPDEDQKKVSEFFEPKEGGEKLNMDAENMDVDAGEEHESPQPQTPKTTGNPGPQTPKTTGNPGKNTGSAASSSSSDSSSSLSGHPGGSAALGEFEDDCAVLPGSPCMVQPEKTRSRIQMFSFPKRHVQRVRKHWGDDAVDNLRRNLSKASVVSLYSGLGGAEIACQLVGNALGSVQTGPAIVTGEPAKPEYLLACDHNNDCQKLLHTHHDA